MVAPLLSLRHSLPFLFLAALPLAEWSGTAHAWLFLPGLSLVFVGFDAALGLGSGEGRVGSVLLHRSLPRLYIPLQLAVTLSGAITARASDMGHVLALALANGGAAGIFGMLAAHEMLHAGHRLERMLGLAMLASVGYMHFRISHVFGHHRLAATRADPATARAGESAFRFLGRSISGQWRFAWRHERRRVAGRRAPALANRMTRYIAIEGALALAAAFLLGAQAVLFLAVQAAVAVFILELFNYIAHYGLRRRVAASGRREPLGPQHSWNAGQRFNNWALFNGGYHSDHHRAPALAYHRLRPMQEAPQLPAGYAGTILLALVPPLWRRVMDPRLAAVPLPATTRALRTPPAPRRAGDREA